MKTLELTNDEIALIQERRKLYDVEKINALEKIKESVDREILGSSKQVARDINNSRKDRLFYKKLVKDLNEEAGSEMFTLSCVPYSNNRKVVRHYYVDEKGITHARSWVGSYGEEEKKYGPEVVEWEKTYSYYDVGAVHSEFPSVKICRDNSGKDGTYYSIQGLGYDVSTRSYKRLSTIIERVKELVKAQRKELEYKKLRVQVSGEFKVFIETRYRDYVEYFSGLSCTLKFENGVTLHMTAKIDSTNETWKAVLREVRYPQDPTLPEGGVLEYSKLLQRAKDWKPLNID